MKKIIPKSLKDGLASALSSARWSRSKAQQIPILAYEYLRWALTKDREDYIEFAAQFGPSQSRIMHAVLGLSGEAGELVDAAKKHFFYKRPLDIENVKEECGDMLWYMAILLDQVGSSFEEVMVMNRDKLEKRYPSGFSEKDAVARKDKA